MDYTLAARRTFALAVALALAAFPAAAQTLYKLIDKKGKVTYSETAPKDFDGKVVRIDVNPNANTATLPKYEAAPARAPADASRSATRTEALKEKVASRRAALADAKNNPGDEDVQYMGNAGGGTRQVPTEKYQRRLAQLERALQEAEDELRQYETGR
jgi:hypothetical protein